MIYRQKVMLGLFDEFRITSINASAQRQPSRAEYVAVLFAT